MNRGTRQALATAFLLALIPALAGCPFSWQKEERDNVPPVTFFDTPRSAEPDTIFRNERFFRWIGTDSDSDVVAYQYQLVEVDSAYFFSGGQVGEDHVIRYVDPRPFPGANCPDDCWSPRDTDQSTTFTALDDGWYEMRVRAIDREGAVDPNPARKLFYVFFDDVLPVAIIGIIRPDGSNDQGCGRLGGSQAHTFLVNAHDESRNAVTDRSDLEYRVQLRATSQSQCQTHIADPFTEWTRFPDDTDTPVVIGDAPPTQYNDLFPLGCTWEFKLEVRDPANNRGQANCFIEQEN